MAKLRFYKGDKTPNGQEEIMRVKSGAKGTGRQYGPDIKFWPWSQRSYDQAIKTAQEIADKNNLVLK